MPLLDSLQSDTVRDLEINPPLTIGPDDPVEQAVNLMRENSTGCVLVCDRNHRLLGIFTERDLLNRVLAAGVSLDRSIEAFMTPDPAQVRADDDIRDAIQQMHSGGFRHLPVVQQDGAVVGILSVRRLIEYFVEHFPNSIYTLPSSPRQQLPQDREGA